MAALTTDKRRSVRNLDGKSTASYVVKTGEVIYHHGMCSVDTATGRLKAGAAEGAARFAGLAEETATGNTAGTVSCKVDWGYEALVNASTVLTVAYVGSNAALTSDDDVTTASNAGTAGVQVLCGEVIQIESGDAWIDLRNQSHRNV